MLLTEFKDLFDGILGDWDTGPVSGGCKTISWHVVSNSKSPQRNPEEGGTKVCELGVLKWQSESEWDLPSFIVPKQNQTVQFVSDFMEVNKRIVRNPFPIPQISTVLQELKGFTYATAHNMTIGYYTIRLDPDLFKICTIIFPWGKYSYL